MQPLCVVCIRRFSRQDTAGPRDSPFLTFNQHQDGVLLITPLLSSLRRYLRQSLACLQAHAMQILHAQRSVAYVLGALDQFIKNQSGFFHFQVVLVSCWLFDKLMKCALHQSALGADQTPRTLKSDKIM